MGLVVASDGMHCVLWRGHGHVRPKKRLRGGSAAPKLKKGEEVEAAVHPEDDDDAESLAKGLAEQPDCLKARAGETRGKYNYTKKHEESKCTIQVQLEP
jgi:hypothetical protein